MPKILPTDWRTQVKIFEKFGCRYLQQKGSHLIYDHPDAKREIVIPRSDLIPVPVIRHNMRTANMNRAAYFQLLTEV